MGIKQFKPTSPGRRGASGFDFSEITKDAPEKGLTEAMRKSGGRNAYGDTTSRFRGGGHRRRYRLIDFKRDKDGIPARVAAIEYDPNRTCRIALLVYADGEKRYILAPEGLKIDTNVASGPEAEPEVGNCLPLADIPLGTAVHNVEVYPGHGGKFARSAGVMVRLLACEGKHAHLVMPSGEMRKVLAACRATIGQVGNADHQHIVLGKAGRTRWKGHRSHVRGMAQNPVSHPMGGGEGRRKGRHPQGPTGVLSKGGRTRKKRKPGGDLIVRRRKQGVRGW